VILPGSVTAAIPIFPGDTISATFDRIGTVDITFSGQEAP
jgi:2-keto-4-pentenoate hydratase